MDKALKIIRRKQRIDALSFFANIVTGIALVFVSIAIIVLGLVKYQEYQAPVCPAPAESKTYSV